MFRDFFTMLARNVRFLVVSSPEEAILFTVIVVVIAALLVAAERRFMKFRATLPEVESETKAGAAAEKVEPASKLEVEKEEGNDEDGAKGDDAEVSPHDSQLKQGILSKRPSKLMRQNSGDKKVKFALQTGEEVSEGAVATKSTGSEDALPVVRFVRVLYGTFRGRSKAMALKAVEKLNTENEKEKNIVAVAHDLATFIPEDLLKVDDSLTEEMKGRKIDNVAIFVVSTYSGGTCPVSCKGFFDWIDDCVKDFRVSRDYLSNVRFAVFGLGSSSYDPEHFCAPSRKLEHDLLALGAFRMAKPGFSDEAIGGEQESFDDWFVDLKKSLKDDIGETFESLNLFRKEDMKTTSCCKGSDEDSCACKSEEADSCSHPKNSENGQQEESGCMSDEEDQMDDDEEDEVNAKEYELGDMEDLALPDGFSFKKKKDGSSTPAGDVPEGPREMVTLTQRKQLTKEGYKIIGTHSAVKLCRWTKAQLRGRGGCYKHTFYNITSHNCMEASPSLACANKCTFCWRHNRHPVGREWRWKMDPPEMIVEQAIEFHRRMIKELRGMPGLIMDRYDEAMSGPHHCALSLVGEPIMYPKINELLADLHRRKISSFLVTNAQFPEAIERLDPVTQLYVSVDAPSRDELKSVDRPLFSDFWERLHASLAALKRKKQRTVYRLTLIKGQNMGTSNMGEDGEELPWTKEALEGYARLIKIGEPDFVEIKGVTYCGKGDETKPTLLMQNVPWHREVRGFCEALCEYVNEDYGLACEHSHSLCVLLARKDRFLHPYGGKWHTWIDYEKFFQLVASGTKDFSSQDYTCETPEWALYASKEEGFDPVDTRWRKNKVKRASIDSSTVESVASAQDE